MFLARRAATQVGDVCFVDFETVVVRSRQARSTSDRAFDVSEVTAISTDDVVMVIAHLTLEERGGTDGLNLAHQARCGQERQGVIDGLP